MPDKEVKKQIEEEISSVENDEAESNKVKEVDDYYKIDQNIEFEDTDVTEEDNILISDESVSKEKPYKADILLLKKNKIETKLFSHILDELKYSYEIAKNVEDMKEKLKEGGYKLALFDKELNDLDLKNLADELKTLDSQVYLVMMVDKSSQEEASDALYVHEIIKNIVNKDLLRLVFEKFV